MKIEKVGEYELLEDFTVRGIISIGTLPKGSHIRITQIDHENHNVIGPELGDWHHDCIPAILLDDGEPR